LRNCSRALSFMDSKSKSLSLILIITMSKIILLFIILDTVYFTVSYYDDRKLFDIVKDFMIESLQKHFSLGLDNEKVYILGKKNAVFLQKINREVNLFKEMVILEHPRYIQQYKSKEKDLYIDKYIRLLNDQDY